MRSIAITRSKSAATSARVLRLAVVSTVMFAHAFSI
jgi:hypothetical protein